MTTAAPRLPADSSDLPALEAAGRFEEARTLALQRLESPDVLERANAALFLIHSLKFDLLGKALRVLAPLQKEIAGHFDICAAVSYAAWFEDDVELCRWAAHRCISLQPQNPAGYLRLGMLELLKSRYAEGFLAFSAALGNGAPAGNGLGSWHHLARLLTQGVQRVQFEQDGISATFALATYNGHALETASCHAGGRFCEAAELQHIHRWIGSCESILEVGAAVGNHTVFFTKALGPKRVNVFDADARAVQQTRQNVMLNFSGPNAPRVIVHHAAVGATAGKIQIFGKDVPMVRADTIVKDRVDFVKIDVDGMEMEVLEGCRGVIERDRPRIMIEVQNALKDRFLAQLKAWNYTIDHQIDRPADTNFFVRAA
jgi:hypothetical protein